MDWLQSGLVFLLHFFATITVSGNKMFLGMEVGPVQWPSLISGEAPLATNRLECAAVCNQDPDCNLFAWRTNKECLVGSSTGSFSFLPQQLDSQVLFIDQGAITSFLKLLHVPGMVWTDYMFEKIAGVSSRDVCAIYCGLIFYPRCQIYVQTTQNCYLGDIYGNKTLFSNASVVQQSDVFLTEYFINETNRGLRDTQKIIMGNINASDWHPPIYKVITTASSELECSAHCTFEMDPKCHLYLFDTSTNDCLLGNFLNNVSATSLGSGTSNVGVQPGFYKEWLESIFPKFETANSEEAKSVTYARFTGNGWNEDVCGTLCYWDDACQMFYFAYLKCFLGSTLVTENFHDGHDARMHFKNESTFNMGFATDPNQFMPFEVYSTAWFEYVITLRRNVTSLDQCGLHCRFYREGCNFMILVEDYCFMGNPHKEREPDEWLPEYVNLTRGMDTIYLNIGYYEMSLKEIFLNQTLPGSSWSPMVYETYNGVLHLKYCKSLCFFNTADCHGFLFDEATLKCHLTRDQVNSSIVTETKALLWHYLKHKAGIIVGGHDSNELVDGAVHVILRGGYECKSKPLPNFDHLEAYETGTVTHGSRVMINGGYGYFSNEILASGHILDLSAPERKWVQCGEMVHRRMSHQLFNLGDKIAVIGGYNVNGSVLELEVYDFVTDTWSLLNDTVNTTVTLPASISCLSQFCLLENEQSVFIIGGRDCDAGFVALSDCWILDKSSLQFSPCPSLNITRYAFGCMMTFSYSYHEGVTNPGIFIRGGYMDDNIPQPSLVEYLPLNGTEWKVINTTSSTPILKPGRVMSYGFNGKDGHDIWAYEEAGDQVFRGFSTSEMKLYGLELKLPPRFFPSQTVVDSSHIWTCPHQSQNWVLLLNQSMPLLFSPGDWDLQVENVYDPLYSNMSHLETLRSCDNFFYFRLVWPRLGYYNEWKQDSNPTTEDEVTNFLGIAMRFTKYFKGLFKLNDGSALLSANDMAANVNSNSWKVGTISSPDGNASLIWDDTISVKVDIQKLFIKKIC